MARLPASKDGSHWATIFETAPLLGFWVWKLNPYGPLVPLMECWNWWGWADKNAPFGQFLSLFVRLSCVPWSDLCLQCLFVGMTGGEKEQRKGNRETLSMSKRLPLYVFWLSNHLMKCLDPPRQWDLVDVVLVNDALMEHHNSRCSSKRLADPNGNVISQIKDGPGLMRRGVMGGG